MKVEREYVCQIGVLEKYYVKTGDINNSFGKDIEKHLT